MYLYILFGIYIMKNNIRLKIRDLVRRGGNRYSYELPLLSYSNKCMDKLQGNMAKQQEMNRISR